MAENKYQRGKIYKIMSPSTDRIYIGSTAEPTLACRMRKHRANYRQWKAEKGHYISSYALIDYDDCMIVLIEAYPCNSRDELRAREQHHLVLNAGFCVNMQAACRPPDEKRAYDNERLECVCGGSYTRQNHAVHIQTAAHRNHIEGQPISARALKRWAYTEQMRENDPKNQKVDCPCGGKYTRQNYNTHCKTRRHQLHIEA